MPEVRDVVDAALLGLFLFGLLLTVATLVLGAADLGVHHGHPDNAGPLHASLVAILVFLTWLGGVGFVLRRAADWPLLAALPIAAILGVGVGAVVQLAVRKLSNSAGSVLEPEQFRLPGTLGRVTSSIRPDGTGEVIYEQGGVRHAVAARSSGKQALPRGTEIVILRFDRGVATVEAFDAFWSSDDGRDVTAMAGRE